jgi:hypothetical protein
VKNPNNIMSSRRLSPTKDYSHPVKIQHIRQ